MLSPGMGYTDQGLPEPPGWHEYHQLVCLLWYHKSELLSPAPLHKESLPRKLFRRNTAVADYFGRAGISADR